MTAPQRCADIKKDGTQCKTNALPGDVFCLLHSPTHADKREDAKKLGGYNKHMKDLEPTEHLPVTKKCAGRATDLTPELQDLIVFNIQNGSTILGACFLADVADRTLASWKKRATEGEEPFVLFFDACHQAEERLKTMYEDAIRAKLGSDWRSALALLERRFPIKRDEDDKKNELPSVKILEYTTAGEGGVNERIVTSD